MKYYLYACIKGNKNRWAIILQSVTVGRTDWIVVRPVGRVSTTHNVTTLVVCVLGDVIMIFKAWVAMKVCKTNFNFSSLLCYKIAITHIDINSWDLTYFKKKIPNSWFILTCWFFAYYSVQWNCNCLCWL